MSEATATRIDKEIRAIVDRAYETAHKILKDKRNDLEKIAEGLLEYETLSGEEIHALLTVGHIDRSITPSDTDKPKKPRSSTPRKAKKTEPEPLPS